MTYYMLQEYQISFPLLKVSKPWKFQMSSLCKHNSKQAIFSLILSFETEWKNEWYLTWCHTKYFPNITLVSFYSKSVDNENSKCIHFVSVQVKHIVQNRKFSSLTRKEWKMSHFWYNGIPKAFRISNWFAFIQSQWSVKIPNVFIFHQLK